MEDVVYVQDAAGKNMFRRAGGLKFAALQFKVGKFFMVFELTEAAVGEVRAWPSDSLTCHVHAQQARLALPECAIMTPQS